LGATAIGNAFPGLKISIADSIAVPRLSYYIGASAGIDIAGVWRALTITSGVKALILLCWVWLGK